MKYKFQVGDLVKVATDIGLVTGLVPGHDPYIKRWNGRLTRYTVLIQGVTCKRLGYALTKVNK